MILSVTLNPSIDRTVFVKSLVVGDTNRVLRTEIDAGGKGLNLSRIVGELGGTTVATGFLGGGPGGIVRERLEEAGVVSRFVEVAGATRVNFSVEAVDREVPPTTFNEPGPNVSSAELEALRHLLNDLASTYQGWVCLSGSVPPGVPRTIYRELGEQFLEAGWRVALDADGDLLREGLRCRPHFIKPNSAEVGRLLGRSVETEEDALRAAVDARAMLQPDGIAIVSMGASGATMATSEGQWLGVTPEVEANSTIGSGDSLIGAFLWALEQGHQVETALRWGLAAGAATATTDGSQIGPRQVIELLFDDARVEVR